MKRIILLIILCFSFLFSSCSSVPAPLDENMGILMFDADYSDFGFNRGNIDPEKSDTDVKVNLIIYLRNLNTGEIIRIPAYYTENFNIKYNVIEGKYEIEKIEYSARKTEYFKGIIFNKNDPFAAPKTVEKRFSDTFSKTVFSSSQDNPIFPPINIAANKILLFGNISAQLKPKDENKTAITLDDFISDNFTSSISYSPSGPELISQAQALIEKNKIADVWLGAELIVADSSQ